jgi:hypothetical protein
MAGAARRWRVGGAVGAISPVERGGIDGGNLALMPLLVGVVRMPVVMANGAAILGCSAVNFGLGDGWVFARTQKMEAS